MSNTPRYEHPLDLRAARKLLNLSQEQAAVRYGVNSNTWGYWERGQTRPSREAGERIARDMSSASPDFVPPSSPSPLSTPESGVILRRRA